MKPTLYHTLTLLFISLLVFSACSKKARTPTLVVNVQNVNGVSLQGATVRAWPTNSLVIDPSSSGIPDTTVDQTGITNVSGEVIFDFPASVVLDLDVKFAIDTGSGMNIGTDTLRGHKVVKIEVIEQKEETNLFNEVVVVE